MKLKDVIFRLKTWPSFFRFTFFEKDKKKHVKKIKYIWNKSIAMSCDIYPIYYPKQIFLRSIVGKPLQYLTYKKTEREKPKYIYVSLDFMDYFISKFLPKIDWDFTLVTGDSDNPTSKYKELLSNKHIIHWFAQNNDTKNEKITSIPIGLDYHVLFTTNFFGERENTPREQEEKIIHIRNQEKNPKLKVFANFHLNLTSKRRRELYKILKKNKLISFQKEKLPRNMMWKHQSKYAFNFSPIGAGLDCHRTWETLALGQIPIVEKTNTPLDDLHKQYPIVIIKDISEITEDNLKKWYKKYSKMFTPEIEKKLTNDYWIEMIKN